jgi:hypothetical protein
MRLRDLRRSRLAGSRGSSIQVSDRSAARWYTNHPSGSSTKMFLLVILRLLLGFGTSPVKAQSSAPSRPRPLAWHLSTGHALPQGGLTSVGLYLHETGSGPPGRRHSAASLEVIAVWCSLFGSRPRMALCALPVDHRSAPPVSSGGRA